MGESFVVMRGIVRGSVANLPLPDVQVYVTESGTVFTDSVGHYELFMGIEPTIAEVTFKKPGYETVIVEFPSGAMNEPRGSAVYLRDVVLLISGPR